MTEVPKSLFHRPAHFKILRISHHNELETFLPISDTLHLNYNWIVYIPNKKRLPLVTQDFCVFCLSFQSTKIICLSA